MTRAAPTQTGFLPGRVVQMHVTTRCNLTCKHCYSSSSPHATRALEVDTTIGALKTLFKQGFERISISGGEPFLYPHLDKLVMQASDMGFRVSIVSNATRLKSKQLALLAPYIDAVAISFDGMPANHDRLRGRQGAFDKAVAGIELLRQHRIPHGVIACITRENLADVPDLYEFAKDSGARLFQVRPLVAMGRGRNLAGIELDAADLERLMVMATLLQDADRLFPVHCDLASTQRLLEGADSHHTALMNGESGRRLSDIVNPWVIDERGRSQAFVYGGSAVVDLPGIEELARGGTTLSRSSMHGLRSLVNRTTASLQLSQARFSDWYGQLSWSAQHVEQEIRWLG